MEREIDLEQIKTALVKRGIISLTKLKSWNWKKLFPDFKGEHP